MSTSPSIIRTATSASRPVDDELEALVARRRRVVAGELLVLGVAHLEGMLAALVAPAEPLLAEVDRRLGSRLGGLCKTSRMTTASRSIRYTKRQVRFSSWIRSS